MSGAWRRLAGRYGMAPSRMVFTADLGTGWRRLLGVYVSFPVVTAILLQFERDMRAAGCLQFAMNRQHCGWRD